MPSFIVNFIGQDFAQVEGIATKVADRPAKSSRTKGFDTSFRPGKPEFQVTVDLDAAQRLGVSSSDVGRELRAQVKD